MARIRSIKPTFFTNEDLAELSPWHRLCFIGLWTHADREGRLEDRPRRLKAGIFPYDDVDMETLLAGLAAKGFIVRYSAEGMACISIVGFLKHQRPKSDEHVSCIPAPLLSDPRGNGAGPRIGDRKEEVGGRNVGGKDSAGAADEAVLFQDAWNNGTTPPLSRCRDLTTKRRKHIRARLTERPLAEWAVVIARIEASRFCRGEVPSRREGEEPWIASFDWVIGSPDVAVKVFEGTYDDRRKAAREKSPPAEPIDWFEECKAKHGGDCGLDRHRHISRMLREESHEAKL